MLNRFISNLAVSALLACPPAIADEPASADQPNRVAVTRRAERQDGGSWVVDYQIKNETDSGIVITPPEVEAKSDGWVSNSRLPGHSTPRRATTTAGADEKAGPDMVQSTDDSLRCRETLSMSLYSDDQAIGSTGPITPIAPISLAPGVAGIIRLRFSHKHAVYGAYDPLLGVRTVSIRVGQETFHDSVQLDREQAPAHPKTTWPEPPADRMDLTRFASAPDSLHLEAHVPGHQYYRFDERPVRHGSRMRLSFRYLVAVGTAGECRVRLAQYRDTPTSHRSLQDAGFDRELVEVGRWTKVEIPVAVDDEATGVGLDFRIFSDANVGEMWVDDVVLEPAVSQTAGP